MSELVERVARAICDEAGIGSDGDACCGRCASMLAAALLAIKAMREPTHLMTVAGWKKAEERGAILGNGEIAMVWAAMVDEALR